MPPALQAIDKYDGHWVAAPVNMHSTNWVWVNKALFDKVGGTEPTTFDELRGAGARSSRTAGVIPVAHGGQAWQDATIFDGAVISAGGPEFYKKAFIELDEEALSSDTMDKAFDQLRAIRGMVDPNFPGRDWNLATAMVINGKAGMQIMGDWAKGEWLNAGKVPGKDFALLPLSRHAGCGDLQHRRVRHVEGERRTRAGRAVQARRGDHGPGLPGELQPQEGLDPGAHRRARTPTSTPAARRPSPTPKEATANGALMGSMAHGHAAPEAVKGAVYDVVTEFFNSDMSSADAATEARRRGQPTRSKKQRRPAPALPAGAPDQGGRAMAMAVASAAQRAGKLAG